MDILDKLAWNIHQALATIENAKEQKVCLGDMFRKVRDVCRERGESFDAWCRAGKFGIKKSQIYRLMNGETTGNVRKTSPMGDPIDAWVRVFHSWDVDRQREALARLNL